MIISVVILGVALAILSAGILLYVSLATGLGPWLAPTLVLVGSGFLFWHESKRRALMYAQAVGSTGGSIAVAVGFALPTFYFLQPTAFMQLLVKPVSFCLMLGGIVLAAGLWGMWIAHRQAPFLLANRSLRFPVSSAITAALAATTSSVATWFVSLGITASLFTCWMRDGFCSKESTPTFFVGQSFLGSMVPLQLIPVAWAIGFLAGASIVVPLLLGMISKYVVVAPLARATSLSYLDFTFAFCGGIVLGQTAHSLLPLPRAIITYVTQWWHASSTVSLGENFKNLFDVNGVLSLVMAVLPVITVFTVLSFPLSAQLLLLVLSYLLIQHLNHFACRTGLGTYGRYMTFAMVPIMLLTSVSEWQITIICVFVGVAGATAVDMLFSYKVATDNDVPLEHMYYAQLLGLLVTAMSIGALFWLLCSQLELGGSELIAHRAQGRALLLHSFSFDVPSVFYGVGYGMVLKWLRVNPMLAFSELIMPNTITIGLSLGASLRVLITEPDRYQPFWSGVFAGDALWVLVRLFF